MGRYREVVGGGGGMVEVADIWGRYEGSGGDKLEVVEVWGGGCL